MQDQAGQHLRIDDDWLVANAGDDNAVVNCKYLDGDPHHGSPDSVGAIPMGIMVGTAGNVRGYLWAENNSRADTYTLTAGVVHRLAFLRIYAQGTTARGIKVLHY